MKRLHFVFGAVIAKPGTFFHAGDIQDIFANPFSHYSGPSCGMQTAKNLISVTNRYALGKSEHRAHRTQPQKLYIKLLEMEWKITNV